MSNYTQEAGNMTLVQVTGPTTITSGKAVIYGVTSFGSGTAGIQLFAGVTQSASMTPMINFCLTATAVLQGFSPMFLRMPMVVSGSGFTVNLLGSSDPNMMIFWNPDGVV
jgi:hypothetical protein